MEFNMDNQEQRDSILQVILALAFENPQGVIVKIEDGSLSIKVVDDDGHK